LPEKRKNNTPQLMQSLKRRLLEEKNIWQLDNLISNDLVHKKFENNELFSLICKHNLLLLT